ncbi:MAG: plastocyanin/azurin family copper-binding protein [Ilumatobacteraceae bacterium]
MRSAASTLVLCAASMLMACAPDDDDSLRSIAAGGAGNDGPAVTSSAADAAGEIGAASYPATGEVTEVLSIDNAFLPEVIEVVAGTEVLWLNNGRNDHDVTPDGDVRRLEWGVGAEAFAPRDTYSRLFDRPGTYVYFCSIHGTAFAGMVGTVVVTPP